MSGRSKPNPRLGRKKLPACRKRYKPVTFMATPAERKLIYAKARQAGKTVSDYCRQHLITLPQDE